MNSDGISGVFQTDDALPLVMLTTPHTRAMTNPNAHTVTNTVSHSPPYTEMNPAMRNVDRNCPM